MLHLYGTLCRSSRSSRLTSLTSVLQSRGFLLSSFSFFHHPPIVSWVKEQWSFAKVGLFISSSCCLQQFSDLHHLFGKFSSVVPYCMTKISQTKAITHIHWHSLSQHVINFCQFTIIWCKKKASSYLLTDLQV